MNGPTLLRFVMPPSLGTLAAHVRGEVFCRILSRRIGASVSLWVAPSYDALSQRVRAGQFEIAWLPPSIFVETRAHVQTLGTLVRSAARGYCAALLRRVGTEISPRSLSGRRAAWVSPQSSGGYLLAMQELLRLGIAPGAFESSFLGSYEAALRAVLEGKADFTSIYAGDGTPAEVRAAVATLIPDADGRIEPFAVTLQATTPDVIGIRARLDPSIAGAIGRALRAMCRTSTGMRMWSALFDARGFAPTLELEEDPEAEAPEPGWTLLKVGRDDRILAAESASGDVLGRPSVEAVGSTLQELLGPVARAVRAVLDEARRTRRPVPLRIRLPKRSGLEWLELLASPRSDPEQMSLVIQRADDQAEVEEELLRLASRPLMDTTAHVELGRDGALQSANRAAHELFPDLIDLGPEHPLVQAVLRHPAAPGLENRQELEIGGRELLVAQRQMAEHDGSIGISATEVTEIRALRKKLQLTEHLASLGTLAAGISHELNNPLAFISSNVLYAHEELSGISEEARALITAGGTDFGELLAALAEARAGALRAKQIIADMKTLARIDLAPSGCDLREALEEALRTLPEISGRCSVRVEGEVSFRVSATHGRLVQVFVNLIHNAAQAMEGTPGAEVEVVIRGAGEPERVKVEIRDSGSGIPPDVLSRVFDPFFTTKPIGVGTGLGLPICHAIVTRMGGEIRLRSTVGVGTTAVLVLPLRGEDVVGLASRGPQQRHEVEPLDGRSVTDPSSRACYRTAR